MFESDILLKNSIIKNYQDNSNLEQYLTIIKHDLRDFEPIPHIVSLKQTDLSRIVSDDYLIKDMGRNIGIVLANLEFSHFINSVIKITENTTETTMESLADTLDSVHDALYDAEHDVNFILTPFSLNQIIRKQKNLTSFNTPKFLSNPICAKELGNNQIFLASKNNFAKFYPESFDKVNVEINRIPYHANHAEIVSTINQKLELKNRHSVARIVVTDMKNIS